MLRDDLREDLVDQGLDGRGAVGATKGERKEAGWNGVGSRDTNIVIESQRATSDIVTLYYS